MLSKSFDPDTEYHPLVYVAAINRPNKGVLLEANPRTATAVAFTRRKFVARLSTTTKKGMSFVPVSMCTDGLDTELL